MATGGARGARIKPNNQTAPGPIGNTTGLIVPQTVAKPHGSSAPPIKPTAKEESWWSKWGGVVHTALDVVGMIPVVGEVADGANALIYAAEGDAVNAALSAASMLPVGGQAATAAKWGKKGLDAAQATKATAKAETKVVKQAAKKEVKEEAAEAGGKNGGNKGGKDKGSCKHLEKGPPGAKYQGGKHSRVREDSQLGVRESHHVPPKSVSPHGVSGGPSISMDYADHRSLPSTGRSTVSPASQALARLANSGPAGYLAAMTTEIADIRSKFGNKYDPAIAWMLLWAACMGYIPGPGKGK